MNYRMFMKIKGKEFDVEIEDITDRKEVFGQESYSKGIVNKFSKPLKTSSQKQETKEQK